MTMEAGNKGGNCFPILTRIATPMTIQALRKCGHTEPVRIWEGMSPEMIERVRTAAAKTVLCTDCYLASGGAMVWRKDT
jgi:hypothetical protein